LDINPNSKKLRNRGSLQIYIFFLCFFIIFLFYINIYGGKSVELLNYSEEVEDKVLKTVFTSRNKLLEQQKSSMVPSLDYDNKVVKEKSLLPYVPPTSPSANRVPTPSPLGVLLGSQQCTQTVGESENLFVENPEAMSKQEFRNSHVLEYGGVNPQVASTTRRLRSCMISSCWFDYKYIQGFIAIRACHTVSFFKFQELVIFSSYVIF
jgi:hypothetical protein